MNIKFADPAICPEWNRQLKSPAADIFHTAEWCRVIKSTYNYRPIYQVATEDGLMKMLFPAFEIRSFLTGNRAVSLPFSDFCFPISDREELLLEAARSLVDLGRNSGWKYIEFRGHSLLPGTTSCQNFFHHQLDLEPSEEKIWKSLKETNRRNIKKARRAGLRTKFDRTTNGLDEFYRLHLLTRKRHGLPAQPRSFFRKIHEHIIARKLGIVVLTLWKNQPVAGAIYFYFNNRAIFKYGASNAIFHHLRPNNLVMWEAILWLKENNCHLLSLGRTDLHDQGLLYYKQQWGGYESVLKYSRYYFDGQHSRSSEIQEPRWSVHFLKRMPLWTIELLGRVIYRHFG